MTGKKLKKAVFSEKSVDVTMSGEYLATKMTFICESYAKKS